MRPASLLSLILSSPSSPAIILSPSLSSPEEKGSKTQWRRQCYSEGRKVQYKRFRRFLPKDKINMALYSAFVTESLILTAAKQLLTGNRIIRKRHDSKPRRSVHFPIGADFESWPVNRRDGSPSYKHDSTGPRKIIVPDLLLWWDY